MHRPSGTVAVRLSLWMLVLAAMAMALVQPVQAGSAAAPEIADPRSDVSGPGGTPACAPGQCLPWAGFVDLAFGWVERETSTELVLMIDSGNNANVYGPAQYDFHFTVAGTAYVAGFHVNQAQVGNGAVTPTGIATGAEYNETLLMITIPKSAIGNPAAGTTMTGLSLSSSLSFAGEADNAYTDTTAAGLDYVFTGGGAAPTNPGDTDNDGLNDTCEMQYFGNLTAVDNATADPDGDGLTNGQECALGTDPTKADTDGDGTNDKDDPFPTDPAQGGTNGTSSTSTSRSSTGSGSPSGSRSSSSGSGTGASDDKCADSDTSDAVDCLQSDVGYLGMSAGGFLAVLVLCIVALATRWSL